MDPEVTVIVPVGGKRKKMKRDIGTGVATTATNRAPAPAASSQPVPAAQKRKLHEGSESAQQDKPLKKRGPAAARRAAARAVSESEATISEGTHTTKIGTATASAGKRKAATDPPGAEASGGIFGWRVFVGQLPFYLEIENPSRKHFEKAGCNIKSIRMVRQCRQNVPA
jgi:hypothetical protein